MYNSKKWSGTATRDERIGYSSLVALSTLSNFLFFFSFSLCNVNTIATRTFFLFKYSDITKRRNGKEIGQIVFFSLFIFLCSISIIVILVFLPFG